MEKDFVVVAGLLKEAVDVALHVQSEAKGTTLKDFKEALEKSSSVKTLKAKVQTFAMSFGMPGFEITNNGHHVA